MENRLPHTVSGLSAGAFMAVQHHVVWSNDVDGVGAIAGGPFWCANANAITAQTACMKEPGLINISELLAITTGTFVTGFIDNPRNLRGDRVWLFSGDRDTEVLTGVVRKLADYYLKLGVDAADLTTVLNVSAEHAMPTLSFGNPCSYFGPPYMNACGYDAAGEMLRSLLGSSGRGLLPPSAAAAPAHERLIRFSQRRFAPLIGLEASGFGDVGLAYVPSGCAGAASALHGEAAPAGDLANGTSAPCRVHVVYHGCHQGFGVINTTFAWHAGYNEVAEPNRIVVLYPQVRVTPLNPKGCWDWWGYTGKEYASNIGLQLTTVRRMVQAVSDGQMRAAPTNVTSRA